MNFTDNIVLPNCQVYWRMTEKPNLPINPFPNFLDITLGIDEDSGYIKQITNDEFWNMMNRIYSENFNIGYLQEGHGLAASYGTEFLEFILANSSKGEKICEIGAGGLFTLNQLKKIGYNVLAVDPSPTTLEMGKRLSIDVINEFYTETLDMEVKFDAIVHYDLLEHTKDPITFLESAKKNLSFGGKLIFGVPNCTTSIASGDVSMALHQHTNYFDVNSIRSVIESAGFKVNCIQPSKHGGVIFCSASKLITNKEPKSNIQYSRMKWHTFRQKYLFNKQKIDKELKSALQENLSIGLYIPLRCFPYLGLYKDYKNFIFFDDNKDYIDHYFDGFPIAVQKYNGKQFIDKLLLFSPSFGNLIKKRLLIDFKYSGKLIMIDY